MRCGGTDETWRRWATGGTGGRRVGVETGLGAGRLADGSEMRLCVVEGPDTAWAPRITGLLGHKRPVYMGHIAAALDRPLGGLQTLFYVGCVGGDPISVAMVAGAHGAGLLGHVYTVPEWRQRRASTLVIAALDADVRGRGYQVLTLGTNPAGHARRIYEAVGFRPVAPGSGSMCWFATADASTVPGGPLSVGPLRWDDWGWISAAAAAPPTGGEPLPRSRILGVVGPGHVEAAFLAAMQAGVTLTVLRHGPAAVGWAALSARDATALGGAWAIDFYVRPDCGADAGALLASMAWPAGPVVCALPRQLGYRQEALRAAGFVPSAPIEALDGLILWVRGLG